jgi:tRNA(fMet)-specific endonuclease VapC
VFLLDTGIATLAFHTHPRVLERIRTAAQPVRLTVVTRLELLRGRIESAFKAAYAEELLRAEVVLGKTEKFCATFHITEVGDAAAALFDRLRVSKKLNKMGRGDLLNA